MIIKGYFFSFLIETIYYDPHLNCLIKTVQMRGHNICFYAELTKIIPNYHLIITFKLQLLTFMRYAITIVALLLIPRLEKTRTTLFSAL